MLDIILDITKLHPSGAWEIRCLRPSPSGDYIYTKTYMGYTRTESILLFKQELKENKN